MNLFRFRPLLLLLPPLLLARGGEPASLAVTPGLLDRLVAEAQEHSPALGAARARSQAAAAAVSAVRTWEDPTASIGLSAPTRRGFKASEEGNLVYGIEQKLPLYDRPALARRAAEAGAAREELAAAAEAARLRRDLQVALYGLARADREAEIAADDLAWVEATLASVDRRYRVGQASQVEWLKAQSARAMADDDLQTRRLEREHGVFALNRLLNREPHAPWPRVELPALQAPLAYTPALAAAAAAANPEVKVARQEAESLGAAAELTRRQRLPDVSVGLEARQYSGDAGLREGTATVSFSVPWLNRARYDDDWHRDRLRQRAGALAAEDQALSAGEELHHHVVELDAARRQALLYRDQLIPLADQALASALAAWERGAGPLQDVLDARRMRLANDLSLAGALADQGSLLAEIAFLAGVSDPAALPSLAGDPSASHDLHSESSSQP